MCLFALGFTRVKCYLCNVKYEEEFMTYELSAALTNILTYSKTEAIRFKQPIVDELCLFLGLLHNGNSRIADLLRSTGVSIEALRDAIEHQFTVSVETLDAVSDNIILNETCRRILRLSVLEARRAGSKMADEDHLLLAILRDKDNKCLPILHQNNITYNGIASLLNPTSEVSAGFGVADEAPEGFPDEKPQGDYKHSETKTRDKQTSDTPVIDNFGTDLTKLAADEALDPVIGRENEIQRIAQILSRRKKNNPILIGEPGVGKSAVVEGLANLIISGKVPRILQHRRIVSLDMASIVAGTQYRGQFEDRLQRLIKELRAHSEIILFIDEIHTIIGAGSAPGSLDAANILKPALARGEIQCIGATTTDEYRKTIEKDGALERRFQKIQLAPTTPEQTLEILRNLKKRYEEHHNVAYTDDALHACVNLTTRYISGRALPDKAIDALDEAGSRVHISGVKVPENIEKLEKCIADLKRHKTEAAKAQNYELAANLRDEVAQLTDKLEHANKDWIDSLKEDRPTVTAEDISTIVSMMSGIPVQRMAQDESIRLRGMKAALQAKVISQDEAISHLVRAITRNRLGLKGTDRPIGTFLFVGPTGVGKTYLVKCLAEWMFGSKEDLIRIDMSEYGEKYSTSRLVGAPPGYVGYDEGGQLTEKVRRHPYSVILLDEIEKAHPDVFNTLLQVMDEGRLTDGNGTTVDFRNTIIIMTSNSGTRQLKDFGRGIGFKEATTDDADGKMVEQIIRKALQKQFSPEFLNRLDDIITFHPLTEADAGKIADLEIGALKERLKKMQLSLELTPAAKDYVVKKGFNVHYGARSLKRSIQSNIEDAICDLIMNETQDKTGQPQTIRFDVVDEKLVAQFTSPTSMP